MATSDHDSARRLEGRVALLTGASSGIGRATARRLASEGATMVLNDIDAGRLDETIAELPGQGHQAVVGDASKEETARNMAACAREKFGRLDILVNNVGIYYLKDVTESTQRDIDLALGVNLHSMIWCCKHAIPTMLEQKKGAIVMLGSISAFTGQEHEGKSQYLYNISKAAAVQLAVSLGTRYGGDGIRVNAICPGVVNTRLLESTYPEWTKDRLADEYVDIAARTTPLGRPTDPSEIAAAIAFLVSDDASIVLGSAMIADGGYLAR